MILKDFALLAADTARSKAYLQAMIGEEKMPGQCVVYTDNLSKLKEEMEGYRENGKQSNYFNINEPLLFSLHKAEIPYVLIETKDINSEEMKNAIQDLEQKYLIYSGYGGSILKPHLFGLHKSFLHVHAGILPQYRGSTTAYYSFLQEKMFGATAIFLNEGIDEGEIITQDTFGVPEKEADIDYIYEPYIRSRVLLKAIDRYIAEGELTGQKQSTDKAETYFIIHPVLKHLALLSLEKRKIELESGNRE